MISSVVKPKSKAELLKALQSANIASVDVYEGKDISLLPTKADLARREVSVIVLSAR